MKNLLFILAVAALLGAQASACGSAQCPAELF